MGKNKENDNRWCAFSHCRHESSIIWLGVGLCQQHWEWVCEHSKEKSYKKLNIKIEEKK